MTDVNTAVQPIPITIRDEMTLTCPECDKTGTLSLSKFIKLDLPIGIPFRVKCRCEKSFLVVFNRRGKHRKKVSMFGECTKGYKSNNPSIILVRNLSQSGIGFDLLGKDLKEVEKIEHLKVKDFIHIEFKLNDEKRSFLEFEAEIRYINRCYVGAEIKIIQEHTRRLLGYYILK